MPYTNLRHIEVGDRLAETLIALRAALRVQRARTSSPFGGETDRLVRIEMIKLQELLLDDRSQLQTVVEQRDEVLDERGRAYVDSRVVRIED